MFQNSDMFVVLQRAPGTCEMFRCVSFRRPPVLGFSPQRPLDASWLSSLVAVPGGVHWVCFRAGPTHRAVVHRELAPEMGAPGSDLNDDSRGQLELCRGGRLRTSRIDLAEVGHS